MNVSMLASRAARSMASGVTLEVASNAMLSLIVPLKESGFLRD